MRMRTAIPEAPATHYRLSEDSKAKAIAEYVGGRTAKYVGNKWRVSAGSIYRWALAAGFKKRDGGDRLAQANAARVEAEEAGRRATLYRPPEPLIASVPEDAEPDGLMRAALSGVAEAMRQERLDEAKTLTGLAEGLGRLALKSPPPLLETVAQAMTDEGFAVSLFSVIGEDPPNPLKTWFWQHWKRPSRVAEEHRMAVWRLEAEVARLKGLCGEADRA